MVTRGWRFLPPGSHQAQRAQGSCPIVPSSCSAQAPGEKPPGGLPEVPQLWWVIECFCTKEGDSRSAVPSIYLQSSSSCVQTAAPWDRRAIPGPPWAPGSALSRASADRVSLMPSWSEDYWKRSARSFRQGKDATEPITTNPVPGHHELTRTWCTHESDILQCCKTLNMCLPF